MNLIHLPSAILGKPWAKIKRVLAEPHYRTYQKLDALYSHRARYQETLIPFDQWKFQVTDAPTFVATYKQLFVDEIYRFETKEPRPYIIDGGANVGLSVLYFKTLFPDA